MKKIVLSLLIASFAVVPWGMARIRGCCLYLVIANPTGTVQSVCVDNPNGHHVCWNGDPSQAIGIQVGDIINFVYPESVCTNGPGGSPIGSLHFYCPCETNTPAVQNLYLGANCSQEAWVVSSIDCEHCSYSLYVTNFTLCQSPQ